MIDFSTLQGLSIPEGVVTQIADASGRVLWKLETSNPAILQVEKITADTYAGETAYEDEQFILLDIYPKTNGTVSVTYGGLTKTITDTSGAETPNAQQVVFGTFNGVAHDTTPASGTVVIEGDYEGFGCGSYTATSKGQATYCSCVVGITDLGHTKKIPDSAFFSCSSLTSVAIPNSVTSIGVNAFSVCNSLSEVHINSIDHWYQIKFEGGAANPLSNGGDLFLNGALVTNVVIPNGMTSINDHVFEGYSNLTSVEIPDSVTSIGNAAFSDCSSLTSVAIPSSVTSIGNAAFSDCSSLTSVAIPSSVTSIGNLAFYNCSSLSEVHINSIDRWCQIKFGGLSNPLSNTCDLFLNGALVTNLVIPNSVTSIGDYTFDGCSSIMSVEIPNSVTSIGIYAFRYCESLTSVEIPDSVTSIGDYAFYGCRSLTSIEIPDSVTSIGDYTFAVCSSLTSIAIPNSVTSIGNHVFSSCSSLTSVEIPDSVTSIGNQAFRYCESLTSVEIPSSVTSIGSEAFRFCSSLTSAVFKNTTGWYVTETEGGDISTGIALVVSDSAVNAPMLTETYVKYYWYRS